MPRSRSPIRKGRFTQRDRGTKRRRDRPRPTPKARGHVKDPSDVAHNERLAALNAWLEDNVERFAGVEAIERLDLKDYLQRTSEFEFDTAERLRYLAIHVEFDATGPPQPRGWRALDRIYREAARRDPNDPWIQHSRAVSASHCVDSRELPREVRRQVYRDAHAAAEQAIALGPDQVRAYAIAAQVSYQDPDHTAEQSLALYERALEVDGTYGWALLYRAHCLHDLERWAEAAEAYAAVPGDFFAGRIAWRHIVLLEQRASCLMHAGDRAGALAAFEDVLDRLDRNPRLVEDAGLRYVTEAAAGPMRDELGARTKALLRRHNYKRLANRITALPGEGDGDRTSEA